MDCRNEGYWGDVEGWDNGSFLLHQSSLGASVHLPLWLLISLLPCSSHLASEALLLVPLASPPPASVANLSPTQILPSSNSHFSRSRLHTRQVVPASPLFTPHSLACFCPPVPGYSTTLAPVISTLVRNVVGISAWEVFLCPTYLVHAGVSLNGLLRMLWDPTHQGH